VLGVVGLHQADGGDDAVERALLLANVEEQRRALAEGGLLDQVAAGLAGDHDVERPGLREGLLAGEAVDAEVAGGQAVNRELVGEAGWRTSRAERSPAREGCAMTAHFRREAGARRGPRGASTASPGSRPRASVPCCLQQAGLRSDAWTDVATPWEGRALAGARARPPLPSAVAGYAPLRPSRPGPVVKVDEGEVERGLRDDE
jgi:hypothetical protein